MQFREPNVEFWHLSFQEFLTARRFTRYEPVIRQQLREFLTSDRPHDEQWRQVVLLLAGCFARSPQRLEQMLHTLVQTAAERSPGVLEAAQCFALFLQIADELNFEAIRLDSDAFRAVEDRAYGIFDDRGLQVPTGLRPARRPSLCGGVQPRQLGRHPARAVRVRGR